MNRPKEIKRSLTLGFICLLFSHGLTSQTLAFHHLNTSNGLSDNNARAATVDQHGFLWIGTRGGLNVYNGFEIQSYTPEQIPAFPVNDVTSLFSDSKNRLWIGFGLATFWMDEKRNFYRITIFDSLSRFGCPLTLESTQFGIILFTNFGQACFDSTKNSWRLPSWLPKEFTKLRIKDAEFIEGDKLIYVYNAGMKIIDYRTGEIILDYPCEGLVSVAKLPHDAAALGFETGLVRFLDLKSGKTIKEYHLFPTSPGSSIQPRIYQLRATAQGTVVVATGTSGLVTIDSSGAIHNYLHDPIDPVSLIANNTTKVWAGPDGEIVALTANSGVSIGNTYYKRAGYTKVFRDDKGRLYDNFFNEIAFDDKGFLWLCGYDRLIRWNRQTKESKYYPYYSKTGTLSQGMEFRALCFDPGGFIWLSAINEGLVIFDPVHETFKSITPDTSIGKMAKNTSVHDLMLSSDDLIWAATNDGFYTIDPQSKKMHSYVNDPVLGKIAKSVTTSFLEDSEGKLWIGTAMGLYGYDRRNGELIKLNVLDSLLSNYVYGMIQGKDGAIYVASALGFNIVQNGKVVKSFSRSNGLRYDKCESFQEDQLGNIWVSNNKCLVKYDPKNGSLQYFEENAGINTSGFRLSGSCISHDGELFWAPQNGINYFYPEQLIENTAPLKVSVYALELMDTIYYLGPDDHFDLRFARNEMRFHIAAVNLSGSGEIMYQYRLDGYDRNWKTETDIRKIEYAGLSPGDYTFHLKASADGVSWTEAMNKVNISILSPLWMKWWVVVGTIFLFFSALAWVIMQRAKKLREKNEELETELAISYFANSIHEQQTVESILWDVAKNCIGRLKFEDCVIYLLDQDTKLLHQVAAHGPKGKANYEIHQPIDIQLGQGIVGTVAKTGVAEIIPNTSLDSRYIVDDKRRYSEISIPIISGGKILGVIDCEHLKKNFFTQKHLSILTTIASLCANKIIRIQAEDEKQLAQLTLMDTQKRMSEVEMQALRAQMNPHFIFNCLNSINRYIVKSDQVTASLYLTRFAKLIRLILDNSNSQNVILSNELEALRLYIEMESLRFDKKFHYQINVAPNVNPDSIEMPPLIIQPYVENAIWHGLLHKPDEGMLRIDLNMIHDGLLEISVEDNGVGREKAMELKSKSALTRKSLGMKLTDDRIALLNKDTAVDAKIQIIDLKNGHGEAAGTKVVFTIPIY